MIKIEDKELYKKLYTEQVLNKLDSKQVFDELGENTVLLCYEKKAGIENGIATCHRRLVADWLEEKLNIKVDEL